jgi:hypothetical protein
MPTKTSGKETVNSAAEVAAQVTEETKAAMDVVMETTVKVAEDTKTLLATNQEVLENSFATWQEYNKTYTNFVLEATQQVLNESLAFRENLDKVMSDSFQKAQALSEQERRIALNAAELFQAQAQAASEYAGKMFTTASKVMTTTALFTDWAAERAAKMFTTISTN